MEKRTTVRIRLLAAVTALVLSGTALSACGSSGSSDTVSVLGPWTGQEEAGFRSMLAGFTKSTGIHVSYTGTRDADAVLASELQNGTPPDAAVLANPGEMRQYAASGRLLPLDSALNPSQQQADYSPSVRDLTVAAGPNGARHTYGIVVKAALKSLIWYDPQRIPAPIRATLTAPDLTWNRLTTSLGSLGGRPWCLGLADTSNSGWPGTDWIEDFLLHQSGAQVYDQWVEQKLAWTDPRVRQAWQAFGAVAAQADGSNAALLTGFGQAGSPMFSQRPGCFLDHEASFIPTFYAQATGSPKAQTDYDFVPFPQITAAGSGAEEIAGDLLGMFRDTPVARRLVGYLTTAAAQRAWVVRPASGAISLNRNVPSGAYPDPLSRKIADSLRNAATLRFDASDSMPHVMSAAFDNAVLEYAANPAKLDVILQSLDTIRLSDG